MMMTNQLYNRLVRIVHNIKSVYLKITTTKNNYYLFFPLFPLPTSSLFYNYCIQRNTKDEINHEQYVPENIKKTFTTSIIDTNIYINYVNIVCTPR